MADDDALPPGGYRADYPDLDGVLPLLASDERAWLAAMPRRIHPGHSWLDRL